MFVDCWHYVIYQQIQVVHWSSCKVVPLLITLLCCMMPKITPTLKGRFLLSFLRRDNSLYSITVTCFYSNFLFDAIIIVAVTKFGKLSAYGYSRSDLLCNYINLLCISDYEC